MRLLTIVLSTAALLTATLSGTAAAEGPRWERSVAEDFTSAAGDLCPFTLHSEVLFDRVYVRTTTYPDGSPRAQEFVGPLVVRLTDAETGRSMVRSLSGSARLTYDPDGADDFALVGPAAVGFRTANGDSLPTGYYVLDGRHVVRFGADGTRTLIVDRGTEENICTTLRPAG